MSIFKRDVYFKQNAFETHTTNKKNEGDNTRFLFVANDPQDVEDSQIYQIVIEENNGLKKIIKNLQKDVEEEGVKLIGHSVRTRERINNLKKKNKNRLRETRKDFGEFVFKSRRKTLMRKVFQCIRFYAKCQKMKKYKRNTKKCKDELRQLKVETKVKLLNFEKQIDQSKKTLDDFCKYKLKQTHDECQAKIKQNNIFIKDERNKLDTTKYELESREKQLEIRLRNFKVQEEYVQLNIHKIKEYDKREQQHKDDLHNQKQKFTSMMNINKTLKTNYRNQSLMIDRKLNYTMNVLNDLFNIINLKDDDQLKVKKIKNVLKKREILIDEPKQSKVHTGLGKMNGKRFFFALCSNHLLEYYASKKMKKKKGQIYLFNVNISNTYTKNGSVVKIKAPIQDKEYEIQFIDDDVTHWIDCLKFFVKNV